MLELFEEVNLNDNFDTNLKLNSKENKVITKAILIIIVIKSKIINFIFLFFYNNISFNNLNNLNKIFNIKII